MANFSGQLREIETLIASSPSSDSSKSFAYSALLHLQEQSSTHPSSIHKLAEASPALLASILADIFNNDEQVAAPAVKCLGFMIYHPLLVAAVPEDGANEILISLTRLVTATKVKSVCNLGVWCISVQQFDASVLASNFDSLLRAVVHALDNPIGSLSTTFEAIQAVMKLANQSSDKMREMSSIWAPPIYRRLISVDKKERDMSERCLSKIASSILPPPTSLSKVVVSDIKQRLLYSMKERVKDGMKVQALQAWGWFLRLLGSCATKNKQLVNDLLKIPEKTFSDYDPQVQIASQVAWEGLIDAFFSSSTQVRQDNVILENGIQKVVISAEKHDEFNIDKLLKVTKLVMTPLTGIISSKCDLSVHSACLQTWCYLLYKLDSLVNNHLVMKIAVVPILDAVFRMGPGSKSIWLWNICLELLDDCILAKCKDPNLNNGRSHLINTRKDAVGPSIYAYPWKHYPVKWLPWDLSRLDFYMELLYILINQGESAIDHPEQRNLASDSASRIFVSLLHGLKADLENPSTDYRDIMSCLNTILRFIKAICEDETCKDRGFQYISLEFIEAVIKELEPWILGSPLYKVALDIKHIADSHPVMEDSRAKVLGICNITHLEMVSPIVYLTVLYFCSLINSMTLPKVEFVMQKLGRFIKCLVSSYGSLEYLHVLIGLMYRNVDQSLLEIWMVMAKALKAYIDDVIGDTRLNIDFHSINHITVCNLLFYPFILSSFPLEQRPSLSANTAVNKPKVQDINEVWKLLFLSVNSGSRFVVSTVNSFPEDLCSSFNRYLDEKMIDIATSNTTECFDVLSQLGEVLICVLDQVMNMKVTISEKQTSDNSECRKCVSFQSSLGFAARFINLSSDYRRANFPIEVSVTTRVFAALARLLGYCHMKHDIISFLEILSSSLLPWFLGVENHDESIIVQLQLVWTGTLKCLQKCWPPIHFDSAFLELHASLLERTLDHSNSSISEPTICFWNSTYGKQTNTIFPQNMLHVLDKLSRSGRLQLCKKIPSFLRKCNFGPEACDAPQRCKVAATHNRSSKRVELVEDERHNVEPEIAGFKRKRRELTEHQKEVRRAQQGRARDCGAHGPGIRTFTTADFSQGVESQDSQEIHDPESILEMLRRAS